MYKGFNNYFNDRKNYYQIFCPYVGRFKKVYKEKPVEKFKVKMPHLLFQSFFGISDFSVETRLSISFNVKFLLT